MGKYAIGDMVPRSQINSSGIQAEMARYGILKARLDAIGRSKSGGRAELYTIDNDGLEFRVLNSNGDPTWEEQDAEAFAKDLRFYGIKSKGAPKKGAGLIGKSPKGKRRPGLKRSVALRIMDPMARPTASRTRSVTSRCPGCKTSIKRGDKTTRTGGKIYHAECKPR